MPNMLKMNRMFQQDKYPKVGDVRDIERHVCRYVKLFFEKSGNAFSPPQIQLEFENSSASCDNNADLQNKKVISSKRIDNHLRLSINTPDLLGVPLPVLQGGVDLELAIFLLSMERQTFQLNFERQILPLFSVSGSAVQILRRLVFHLEEGLKRFQATRLLIEMGHGSPQFLYYYFMVSPAEDNGLHYRKLAPHHWMRALFLSRMGEYYMALSLLDGQENMMGMIPYWWDCHNYVLAEDRRLLEKITTIAGRETSETFAHRIVEMFNIIRKHLL